MVAHDGDEAVRWAQRADAVIVEFWLLGTHRSYLGKVPPTGSRFRVRTTAYFVFDDMETLVCERIYLLRHTDHDQANPGGLDVEEAGELSAGGAVEATVLSRSPKSSTSSAATLQKLDDSHSGQ
jgi:hypothetical protein